MKRERSATDTMQELIEKLLFLARADQKRQVLHKERLKLEELVSDVVRKAQMVDKNHGNGEGAGGSPQE